MEHEINSITKRQIARCLTKLEEINTAEIIKDTVKAYFWFLADDIKSLSKEQGQYGDYNHD